MSLLRAALRCLRVLRTPRLGGRRSLPLAEGGVIERRHGGRRYWRPGANVPVRPEGEARRRRGDVLRWRQLVAVPAVRVRGEIIMLLRLGGGRAQVGLRRRV